MEYYQGSLWQFTEELLANERGNGQIILVAHLDSKVVDDMNNKGVILQSESIAVTQ